MFNVAPKKKKNPRSSEFNILKLSGVHEGDDEWIAPPPGIFWRCCFHHSYNL